ncbi:hypothetical protein ACQPZF_24310 [Actinosynnema sp. CS-041913]|uniref:hypothetical protein n=1 Tax=Actinosynnema sp. CS-041913 TaxID=3239917 RepID=UPI003D89CAD3
MRSFIAGLALSIVLAIGAVMTGGSWEDSRDDGAELRNNVFVPPTPPATQIWN